MISMLTVSLVAACGAAPLKKVGGPCTYNKIPGIITITSIEKAPEDESNCKDAVKVMFTFTPTDPTAQKNYAAPGWSDEGQIFTVGGGTNPNREWVERKGITAGQNYGATRNEIRSGTCTPVIFEFTSIDTSDYATSCY